MFKTNYEEHPMDPATLATTVLAILSPYLVKAGGKLAEEVQQQSTEQSPKKDLIMYG